MNRRPDIDQLLADQEAALEARCERRLQQQRASACLVTFFVIAVFVWLWPSSWPREYHQAAAIITAVLGMITSTLTRGGA